MAILLTAVYQVSHVALQVNPSQLLCGPSAQGSFEEGAWPPLPISSYSKACDTSAPETYPKLTLHQDIKEH